MRTILFLTLVLVAPGCKEDKDSLPAECTEIVEACHPVDPGTGAIHECHESAEGAWTKAECTTNRPMCLSLCNSADAGANDAHSDDHHDDASADTGNAGDALAKDSGGPGNVGVAAIAPFGAGTITGKVTFLEIVGGVQVTYALENCPAGDHPTHIHAGTGCADSTQQGAHWGPTRGEGIGTGAITCGSDKKGTLVYTRMNTDPTLAWTVGGDATTSVVGHPVVIHGLVASDREGCGVIQHVDD